MIATRLAFFRKWQSSIDNRPVSRSARPKDDSTHADSRKPILNLHDIYSGEIAAGRRLQMKNKVCRVEG